jgi:hypothetical protein
MLTVAEVLPQQQLKNELLTTRSSLPASPRQIPSLNKLALYAESDYPHCVLEAGRHHLYNRSQYHEFTQNL